MYVCVNVKLCVRVLRCIGDIYYRELAMCVVAGQRGLLFRYYFRN